ncbi:MAG TPA: MbcA/ParS/Xre antitoxin family protein [Thermodesulfovibrionales bacterium]|nr:MbcA/ParS/Xre antitoxin family protein [Thermodesulfovibrionales bacterium]
MNTQDQAALLGLSGSSKRSLDRYRKGSPLPDRRDLLDRVANLLSIHRSLRILFPKNRELVYKWPITPNRAFNGQTPVEVIRRQGFSGLLIVKHYLDYKGHAE